MQRASTTTTVYFVRHGCTSWNLEQRFQGRLDIPLNELGLRQAEAVTRWLCERPERVRAVYTSDLYRAVQTAELIGRALDVPPVPIPDLREIDCGEWAGLSLPEVEARFPGQMQRWDQEVESFRLPGGESILDVQRRAGAYFRRMIAAHESEAIVVVAHGVVLTALLTELQGSCLAEVWRDGRFRMGNTGVTEIKWDHITETCTMPVINSLAHLEGFPRTGDGWPTEQTQEAGREAV